MLLTITTIHQSATDLGWLLHKHPDKFQTVELSVGKAHVFYPESSEARTTAALQLDIDGLDLARRMAPHERTGFSLYPYVNDRPYVASSFMSAALAKAYNTAMNARCNHRPELVEQSMPLVATIAVVAAPKGGEMLIRKLFEPLGYTVSLTRHPLDEQFPAWGDSRYYTIRLECEQPLHRLLKHLYVLLPVLDFEKHYFVSEHEVEKLLAKGKDWLNDHPERDQIVHRYLMGFGSLKRSAIAQLDTNVTDKSTATDATRDDKAEPPPQRLHQLRLQRVAEAIRESGATSVLDLGCGEGKLLQLLLRQSQLKRITGMDVAYQELMRAKERLHYDDLAPRQRDRLTLIHGSLTYRDERLKGYEAAAIVEVIEHLDERRLAAFEACVFGEARPRTVILTTPNAEYNVNYLWLAEGAMRHDDHRFEWSREECRTWASRVADTYGYRFSLHPLGEEDPEVGAPSQMVIFEIE